MKKLIYRVVRLDSVGNITGTISKHYSLDRARDKMLDTYGLRDTAQVVSKGTRGETELNRLYDNTVDCGE